MKLKLDKEEQALLESFKSGEWVRVANPEAEIKRHQQYGEERQAGEYSTVLENFLRIAGSCRAAGHSVSNPYGEHSASLCPRQPD